MSGLSLEASLTMARANQARADGRVEATSEISGARREALRAQADDFETMFLEQMFGHVFAAGGDEGTFGEAGPGSEVYRSMLVSEYAGMVAKGGGVGLSDQIYAELLKMQEG
ncbi:MAG: rod-binding protein [Salinarimonas sp.]|nr:rod-binding protein [Salinarimonas sp.]